MSAIAAMAVLPACAAACGHGMVMELRSSVIYERPRIDKVHHTMTDARPDGGGIAVEVFVVGDPGLAASFDIGPGLLSRQPMQETEAGRYRGQAVLPGEASGGPYWITGRLQHEKAGEVILRDDETLTIPLLDQ